MGRSIHERDEKYINNFSWKTLCGDATWQILYVTKRRTFSPTEYGAPLVLALANHFTDWAIPVHTAEYSIA
jgi:hypothetical protein